MESSKLCYAAVILALLGPPLSTTAAPGVFDVFSWGLDQLSDGKINPTAATGAKSDEGTHSGRRCVCDGSWCRCCVDLSLAGYIDIGGPGCVDMRYISQEEGVKLNMTYGDTLLHGAQVKAGDTAPICMDLLSDLAQVCASMKNLRSEGDGLRGCASLEPTLLGDIQEEYHLGCFTMGPDGMIPDAENITTTEKPEEEEEEETSVSHTTAKPEVNEAALIAAVNESAEEGIAWFSSLLGISFGGNQGNSTSSAAASSPSSSSEPSNPSSPSISETIQSSSSVIVPDQQSNSSPQRQQKYSEIP
ncbi:uncharacterized protein LOC142320886 [Lycorma delicatula]|uniref:uncharacterized protein LOC142320886 n=1 Tax=Lycorma delicatula TaxID=130591 RepID=UPI003F51A57B